MEFLTRFVHNVSFSCVQFYFQTIQGIQEGLAQADDESRAELDQTLNTFAGLSNDDVGAAKIAVVVVTAILLVLCIFWIITCSLLIHGARKVTESHFP